MLNLSLPLERDEMLRRMMTRDASSNGLFLTGVITTGIYCLPSCPARKPKEENVVFYATEDEARRAGLRACKRCRPNDVVAGRDPDRDRLAAALAALAKDPLSIPDASALAERVGVGLSKLHQLARRVEQTTPTELIHRRRIEAAQRILASSAMGATEVALAVGYESVSAFYTRFKQQTGTTPGAWRDASTTH